MNPRSVIVLALYVGGLVIANAIAAQMIGGKLFGVELVFTAGTMAYPLSFVLQDVIAEVEGERRVKAAILGSFLASLLLVVYSKLATHFAYVENDPSDWSSTISAMCFDETFRQTPRIVLASLSAFLIGSRVDVAVFFAIRRVTGEPHLWLRKLGSTVVGQAIDTLVFVVIAFAGQLEPSILVPMVVIQWAMKVAVAVGGLPFSYAAIAWAKR